MANHYLFEPVVCTPAAGWGKGQIENQVSNIREGLFTPRAVFKNFQELNAWLAKRCEALAHRKHPTLPTPTIADCFVEEQPLLQPVNQPIAGYLEHLSKVSKLSLVRWDRNRDSVPVDQRKQVRLFNAVDLVNRLEQEKQHDKTGTLARRLVHVDAVILDELGYLPFPYSGGAPLFHPISQLYERTSLIITTNLKFSEWVCKCLAMSR